LEELNDLLVVLGFGDIGGLNKEGDPIVTAVALEAGGEEVVSVDEVVSVGVDEDDDVDLVAGVDVVCSDAGVDQSNYSAGEVEGGVGGGDGVEPEPGELTENVVVSIMEG
jgi:hypothetical protein